MLDYPEPTVYATPFFIATVAIEAALLARWKRDGRDVVGYEKRDTWASLGMGIGSLVTVTAINAGIFFLATWLWRHRLLDLGTGALGWLVAVVGWDFLYYWHHRVEHESRFLWASHVNHHSSRHFNLSTALRQPWTPWTGLLFFPPLAFFGVAPWMIMVSAGINLIYQYWIHTEAIGRMPRWFEAVFNTPSHHRVHHGSNPEYLDKNYAGILIVWDRLFGTFTPEDARVIYGLTKNIETFNPFRIAFHEYAAIARDVRAARTWRRRAGIVVRGPGWKPSDDVT
ncbi:MAG: sterol desaturase family protein [Labilithrix sp.]|nr:sterol desaturase family protein [Labilithrix sp.]MCW5814975.1 sterol desaturase family protein [Labilithrix sp.]